MVLVDKITIDELLEMQKKMTEPIVKCVVDIVRRLLVVDAGLHADEELLLIEHGSVQTDLWGINIWPELYGTDEFIEFDSMINIRPLQNNRTRSVNDPDIRRIIIEIVSEKVYGQL